jgi:RimJ/RimL family protein N-acetyltransferase
MVKPEYSALTKQVFHKNEYSIVPIRMEDRFKIMKWRNEQIYHLRQSDLLTGEAQDKYFSTVVASLFDQANPPQLLFSYLEEEDCIGYGGLVHINWKDQHAEISFVMDTSLEEKAFGKHWSIFLSLVEQVAFEQLVLHKVLTYAFDLRPHLYDVLESCGYRKEGALRDHISLNGEFVDVVIHSKLIDLSNIQFRNTTLDDAKLLFEWANDDAVRQSSFNPGFILWADHLEWLNTKLKSQDTKMFICQLNDIPVGQVRLDFDGEAWVVDYSIDKSHRGRGFGFRILELLKEEISSITLTAYVKASNVTSVKVFEKAGFKQLEDILVKGSLTRVYKIDT